jgi:hypothetical protein
MRKFYGMFAVLAVALALVGGFARTTQAAIADSHWTEKQLRVVKTTGVPVDTVTVNGVADSLRTEPIDMSDWDTSLMLPTGVPAHQAPYAYINFVITGGTASSADTAYFTIEKFIGGVWTKNRTISAAVGAIAMSQDGGTTVATSFTGALFIDNDRLKPVVNDLGGCNKFRIRWGRTSDTVPIQIRAFLVYPRRDDSSY